MNSVFSAFKGTKNNDKQKSLIGNNKKVNNNSQENSYENLRHIREIGSSTKMMTSIVNDDVEEDLLNLRKRPIIRSTMLNETDCYQTTDVVDHSTIPMIDLIQTQQQNNIDSKNLLECKCLQTIENVKNTPEHVSTISKNCSNINNINNISCDNLLSPNIITNGCNIVGNCNINESNIPQTSDNLSMITPPAIRSSSSTSPLSSMTIPPPAPSSSRCSSSCSNSSSTSCEITIASAASSINVNNYNNDINARENNSNDIDNVDEHNDNNDNDSIQPKIININNKVLLNDNHTQPIIMSTKNRMTGIYNNCSSSSGSINNLPNSSINLTTNSATTTPKNTRYNKPRLSISGFTNSSMPSVHGRPTIATGNGNGTNGQPKARLSTHQRNLSLDFRSMGILLPPVSQVTNTRINLTQHHRNRSLDSALQRIPEVEVSSPNAENENTFCTNSILGSTMCSKIVTSSSTNPQNTPKISSGNNDIIDSCTRSNANANIVQSENPTAVVKISDCKKREDLTSLGSDDSGIICGSESEVSLNRIRQSHESLDSGEIDPEEECIEILETTSMDEEYRMLQNDLCFYQTPEKDMRAIKNRRKSEDQINDVIRNHDENRSVDRSRYRDQNTNSIAVTAAAIIMENNRICVPIDIDEVHVKSSSNSEASDITPTPTDDNIKSFETVGGMSSSVSQPAIGASPSGSATTLTSKTPTESKPEHIKNEILFKNFFGATKNAIFRTAQSIIENHEKKNSAKNKNDETDLKSPTEIAKKKEFFVLKSSSNKNKVGIVFQSPTDIVPSPLIPQLIPEVEMSRPTIPKSSSTNSLNKLKVPGMVKCLIREKECSQLHQKIEKGPSGLLRFFESPVFNIHFAVHYLFYSKEPGVLSFIGNKVFSFPDQEVDLYIPQLIVMYIQMDELAEVLDPYLTYRCRKSVDFSLKCLWLLEAYNYQLDALSPTSTSGNKKKNLSLMKELYSKKERKQLMKTTETEIVTVLSPIKKTHHRSQSDATGLLNDSRRFPSSGALTLNAKIYPPTPAKLCLGDLTSGKAFDNGCICFESVRGTVNDLLGHKTVCCCGAPKMAPQKEFMKALINIGKNLTVLQTKAEKTSALRMFLNLINKNLPARVWLPLHSDIPHHIIRITEEKTAVLNSKDKTPYIIYVEVVEVDDIYSSPVILKMMPTLRHTKSEEHLDSKENNNNSSNTTNTNNSKHNNNNSTSNLSTKDSGTDCNNGSNSSSFSKDSKVSESSSASENGTRNELHFTEDDVWSQEDDEITAQYLNLHKMCERDAISQMSLDSCDSRDQGLPTLFNIGDVRTRHCNNLNCENTKPFSNDPEDPSAAALKEPWDEKEKQIRESSPYGHLSNWRLLSAIVKCGDDLRQELMATQLLQMFKIIWQEENVDLWVRPYKIVCLSDDSGLIEPILNTVSLHQIKKNSNKSLRDYFMDEYGEPETIKFKTAQRNFVQSCAAYCLISYLLQVKDRHNGNILLHSDGHLIHIDFGFILSISPKNLGFEQSPFKLTPEFVDVMGGNSSELWTEFNHLLLKGLMAARKHMDRIINLVEIMRSNAQLPCFKNGCSGTVQNLRKRFHMNLTEQELEKKVEQLVQDSLKSLSTKLYDGYQYYTNGIL